MTWFLRNHDPLSGIKSLADCWQLNILCRKYFVIVYNYTPLKLNVNPPYVDNSWTTSTPQFGHLSNTCGHLTLHPFAQRAVFACLFLNFIFIGIFFFIISNLTGGAFHFADNWDFFITGLADKFLFLFQPILRAGL